MTKTLFDISTKIGSGATPRGGKSVYLDKGVTFIRSQNILDFRVSDKGMAFIDKEAAHALIGSSVKNGDVLINITGDSVARTALWSRDENARVSQHVAIIRPDPSVADGQYLQYWLATPRQKKHLLSLSSTGGSRAALTKAMLEEFPFGPHPLPEQRKISSILSALDDKIGFNQRVINTGQETIRAHWDLISNSGEIKPLSDVADISPKIPTVRSNSATYLDMKNLPENGLLVSEWGEREPKGGARFQNGDTLLARITPCFENGKAAWVDFLCEGEIAYGSTEYIVLRANPGIPEIVPYLIGTSTKFRDFAAKHRTGTSGRQRVQAKELADYPVCLPDAEAMQQFDEFATPLLKRLGAARDESRTLAATRDELLPLLMSGKITVKDAEKRVEDEV